MIQTPEQKKEIISRLNQPESVKGEPGRLFKAVQDASSKSKHNKILHEALNSFRTEHGIKALPKTTFDKLGIKPKVIKRK